MKLFKIPKYLRTSVNDYYNAEIYVTVNINLSEREEIHFC
jgi:hypothetical protein